jgi:GAF domain-containing protein
MADDRLGQILAELSAGEEAWTSARLCDAFSAVAGVTGAGVMLMSGDVQRGSLSVSDEVSRQMEELQYTFGEGPCLDAYRQDRIVAEPDLADPLDLRWLAFSPAALQAGIRAVFGFPLQVGAVRLGALNLYRDRPGPLSGEQHADTVVLAGVAAHWVLQAQATANPGMLATELKADADLHFAVHNAAGIVSVQEGISVADALIRLRAFAFANDRRVTDVARDVIARRLRLG